MRYTPTKRGLILHAGLILLLLALNFVLPEYHRGIVARVLVLSVFAMGYNLTFGYGGLLSLGHAMFFAAGLYGTGLALQLLEWNLVPALLLGLLSGGVLALVVGVLALRTTGVAFMIVTLMFAQAFHALLLYYTPYTRGEEGFVLAPQMRQLDFAGGSIDLTDPGSRYLAALLLFSVVLMATLWLIRAPFGRSLTAVRENEPRMVMLGYNTFLIRLRALALSGVICAASGAAYGVLFGYVGAGFAATQYSILPLLWVLVGGAATTLGPFFGTLVMFYLIDLASDLTSAYLLVVGAALIAVVLFFRKGIVGTLRERVLPWLP